MNGRLIALPSILTALTLLVSAPAAGQSETAGKQATPRTPWGAPDLQGTWDRHTITPLQRPEQFADREFLTEEEVAALEQGAVETDTDEARQEGERDVRTAYNDFWWDRATTVVPSMRTSLIIDPPTGRIPSLTPAAERRAEVEDLQPALRSSGAGGRGADSWLDRSLWERCISRGSPRLGSGAYNANVQIFQTPDHLVLLEEMVHEYRIIPLDQGGPLDGRVRQLLGSSRGHWEGDTLVVETSNFTDKTNFQGSAETLKTIERFTRADDGLLRYEVTFDDPDTWTAPWTAELEMPKSQGQIYEYACHEGNYGMMNLLSGARAEERVGATTDSR